MRVRPYRTGLSEGDPNEAPAFKELPLAGALLKGAPAFQLKQGHPMTKRVTSALVAVGLISTLSGCIESALNPDDPVTVSGSALNEDKSPLANADLVLGRSENSTCAITTSNFATVKTDANGAWSWKGTG